MNLTDANFEQEVIKSNTPVLVDFFAEWCGPCKMMGPIIEDLAGDMKDKPVKIGKLDIDQAPETIKKYSIMSVPTLIIFKDGEPVETMSGLQNKEALIEKLNKMINDK